MTIIPEDKLDGIILKGKELEEQLGQENTSEKFVELSKEYSEIQSLYNASIEWKKFSKEIIGLKNIIEEETSDIDIKDLAQDELKDLEDKDVVKLAKIIKKEKIESVAVCCLFSYLFADHEIRIREIFKNLLPNVKISLSHEVFPRWREYERASTTIIDAFLKPSVSAYVKNLQNGLHANPEGGIQKPSRSAVLRLFGAELQFGM